MGKLSPEVERSLGRQIGNVAQKNAGEGGKYPHEPIELVRAALAMPDVVDLAGIAQVGQSLTTPESRHATHAVEMRDGRSGVLKIMGHTREPGEDAALRGWAAQGLPVVPVLASGRHDVEHDGTRSTVLYIVTERQPGTVMARFEMPEGDAAVGRPVFTGAEAIAPDLYAAAFAFRNAHLRIPGARPWHERMFLHYPYMIGDLQDQLGALAGEFPDLQWTELAFLRDPYAFARAVSETAGDDGIFGDLTASSVLVLPTGERRYFDPPGAVKGDVAFDLAQTAVQVGGAAGVADQLGVASGVAARLGEFLDEGLLLGAAVGYLTLFAGWHLRSGIRLAGLEQPELFAAHYRRVEQVLDALPEGVMKDAALVRYAELAEARRTQDLTALRSSVAVDRRSAAEFVSTAAVLAQELGPRFSHELGDHGMQR